MARVTSPPESNIAVSQKGKAIEEPEGEDEIDDDEEGESEYEIEAIMDAKRGVFENGRIGYLVKWKGYGPNENSWVDENDIGNAGDLVKEFWNKHPKKSAQISAVKKKSRQSTGGDSAEAGKKRGRKSNTKANSDDEDEDVPSTSRANKKARKVNGNSASAGARTESPEIGGQLATMHSYMHIRDWDQFIKSIDTVERSEDGDLFVYFTLHEGIQIKEPSTICKERFPQKLLDFYESNLRWKAAEED